MLGKSVCFVVKFNGVVLVFIIDIKLLMLIVIRFFFLFKIRFVKIGVVRGVVYWVLFDWLIVIIWLFCVVK